MGMHSVFCILSLSSNNQSVKPVRRATVSLVDRNRSRIILASTSQYQRKKGRTGKLPPPNRTASNPAQITGVYKPAETSKQGAIARRGQEDLRTRWISKVGKESGYNRLVLTMNQVEENGSLKNASGRRCKSPEWSADRRRPEGKPGGILCPSAGRGDSSGRPQGSYGMHGRR